VTGAALSWLAAVTLAVSAPSAPTLSLERLLATSQAGRWDTLSMGESVIRFARAFEGTPYLDHTLDVPGPEACRVTTRGFDCVTFMETSLDLARVIHADLGGRDLQAVQLARRDPGELESMRDQNQHVDVRHARTIAEESASAMRVLRSRRA